MRCRTIYSGRWKLKVHPEICHGLCNLQCYLYMYVMTAKQLQYSYQDVYDKVEL